MSSRPIPFSDLELSRRLERAEGRACCQFAEARRRAFPNSGAKWIECAGAYAVFDGVDSPVTQTFGLGLFEAATATAMEEIEHFFLKRGASVQHEVSPFAGTATLNFLCARGYRPIEISSVLYRTTESPALDQQSNIRVRVTGTEEMDIWSDVSARGWSHDHPELLEFFSQFSAITYARENSVNFLAEIDGKPGAAGVLSLEGGVALFGGAATVPELRCRGLQSALLTERMRYACDHGCDLAMMVAAAGSGSQHNAERKGFRIAYTRTKWRLEVL